MKANPTRGFFELTLTAVPEKAPVAGAKFVGNVGAVLKVKVVAEIVLDSVELWSSDADGSTASKVLK